MNRKQFNIATQRKIDKYDFKLRRLKTVGSEMYTKKQPSIECDLEIKTKIRKAFSKTDYLDQQLVIELENQQMPSNTHQSNCSYLTPKRINRYDEQDENLTQQFMVDWSRMDTTKRQTYYRLRNKLVQKYPIFRQKYKKRQIEVQSAITSTNIKQLKKDPCFQRSSNVESVSQSIRKLRNNERPKAPSCFYSRSAKKCLLSTYPEQQKIQKQKEIAISRLNYLTYMKNHNERRMLKNNKVKGQSMIKTRQSILSLQKQGTKSFISLKRSLQDAIETCIREQ